MHGKAQPNQGSNHVSSCHSSLGFSAASAESRDKGNLDNKDSIFKRLLSLRAIFKTVLYIIPHNTTTNTIEGSNPRHFSSFPLTKRKPMALCANTTMASFP
eukprot:1153812-Pelagomonas_calceolata.AAC.2